LNGRGVCDVNAHGAGRALYALNGGLNGGGVQIGHFLPRDLFHLLLRNLADLIFVGRARSLGDTRRALQQHRCRRSLGDKRKGTITPHRDHHRDNQPLQFLGVGARIELLAEFHDVDLRLPKGGAHWGRRCRLARRNLQLDLSDCLLSHKPALELLAVSSQLSSCAEPKL
jgi:hypothetical protein